jgi:hypothetical protein
MPFVIEREINPWIGAYPLSRKNMVKAGTMPGYKPALELCP